MPLSDLYSTLQPAIGPVILVSGVGLLLLTMTNRLGRVIDRSRIFTDRLSDAADHEHELLMAQLRILARRARLVRTAIALAALSVLLASVLVIMLFLDALLHLAITGILVWLFILCMGSLILSLLLFLSDINLSLKALWLEMPPDALR